MTDIPKELEPVVAMLMLIYSTDLDRGYIRNPIAHSLYQTWQHFNCAKYER